MQAEISEADTGGLRAVNRVAGRARKHYLPTVGCEADPSRSVNGDAHVSCVGQSGTAGVQADPDPYPQVVRPDRHENLALNDKRGVQSRRRLLEDREQLVGASVDLTTTRLADGATEQPADIGPDPGASIAKVTYEARRVLDVGEQEGHEAGWQRAHLARASLGLPTDADILELAGDEAHRHDPVLLGGLQQPRARPISGRFVLEGSLVEARECVADVGLVVDRQPAAPARIDVCEGTVGQAGTRLRIEIGHWLEVP